nr:hypothetical protein [Tanacetum cinerariifolium]
MGYAPVQAPPFAPKPKNPPTPKKDNPAKDVICHQCGEVGAWDYCSSTPPYTPQHNSMSERRNRTLLDMVRFMTSQTTFSKSFWDYAFESAARILNMVPNKKVDKIPYEVWHGQAPNSYYLKVWGWIDYEETFSLVAYIRAIGILIAIAAFYDNEIWQIDVKLPSSMDISMKRCFAMKDLGEAAYILGIKIYIDRSKRLIGLCQSAYIEKILKRFYMKNSKRGTIPMQEKLKFSKSQGASTPAEIQRMQNISYASVVGSIMYVVRCTRPDVAFAQNITSRFQQNHGEVHWTTVKNIVKYLHNMFLVYRGDMKRELRVSCYTNAGYLIDADNMKSQTGYVSVLNEGVVD